MSPAWVAPMREADDEEQPDAVHEALERLARGEDPDAVVRAAYDAGCRSRWRLVSREGAALEVVEGALTDEERAGLSVGPYFERRVERVALAWGLFYAASFLAGAALASWSLR